MTRNGCPEESIVTRTSWDEESYPGNLVSVKAVEARSGGTSRKGTNGEGSVAGAAAALGAAISVPAPIASAARRITSPG
jgi:hypothetical protein